jgi:hypothetical protein
MRPNLTVNRTRRFKFSRSRASVRPDDTFKPTPIRGAALRARRGLSVTFVRQAAGETL